MVDDTVDLDDAFRMSVRKARPFDLRWVQIERIQCTSSSVWTTVPRQETGRVRHLALDCK